MSYNPTDRLTDFAILSLLFGGIGVYYIYGAMQIRNQRIYEEAYLSQHREIINQHNLYPSPDYIIQLAIPDREREYLLKLCKESWYKWPFWNYTDVRHLAAYQPRVEVQFVALRRLGLQLAAIRAEMIRCNEDLALVDSGDGVSGYVLKRCPRGSAAHPHFHIYTKFYFKRAANLPQNERTLTADQQPSTQGQTLDRDLELGPVT